MSSYNVISADSHIVEPPDLYESRIEPKFLSRAPRMERHRTRTGQEYDAWYFEGMRVGTVGSVIQAGRRFEDPGSIDFLGVWEDVRKAADLLERGVGVFDIHDGDLAKIEATANKGKQEGEGS